MKKHVEYTLFTKPLDRRMFYWLLFLCPVAALLLLALSRRTIETGASPAATSTAA